MIERVMFHYAEIIIEIFYLLFIIHHKPTVASNIKIN